MKTLTTLSLILNLCCFSQLLAQVPATAFSQQSVKAAQYVGFGMYNLRNMNINETLRQNQLKEVRSLATELNYGFYYCPKAFGFYGEGFVTAGSAKGKSKFFGGGSRVGLMYKIQIGEKFVIRLTPYYRWMLCNARVVNKADMSASSNDLGNTNGGILQFTNQNHAFGSAAWYEFQGYCFKFGVETMLKASEWKLENNSITGMPKEQMMMFYVGFSYNFKTRK